MKVRRAGEEKLARSGSTTALFRCTMTCQTKGRVFTTCTISGVCCVRCLCGTSHLRQNISRRSRPSSLISAKREARNTRRCCWNT
jgi:hypothetical protein